MSTMSPRRVLNIINEDGVTEMRRHRNKRFCCGGGGGRVFMEEKIGKRINQSRVSEALDTQAEVAGRRLPFLHHDVRGWHYWRRGAREDQGGGYRRDSARALEAR